MYFVYCIVSIICLWRRVSDFNPTLALAAETIFLPVSDYINCIALLCLNKHVCMYVWAVVTPLLRIATVSRK